MSADRLAEIKARAEAATPGPSMVLNARLLSGDVFIEHSREDVPWLVEQVERLERWKAEALEVMSGLQALGKALGLQPGVRITGPAALAEVARLTAERDALSAQVAAVQALHWDVEGKCAHCRDCYHDDYLPWPCPTAAALASSPTPSETGEGEHVAREVFTAEGIPFVRCSCTNAMSPTSHRWLSEHVPNGGVAELQAVVKRQAEGAKA